MDYYKFISKFASNLLMLEDFSILNPTAQVREVTQFITRTCNDTMDIEPDFIEDVVADVVNEHELEGMVFPELATEQPVPRRKRRDRRRDDQRGYYPSCDITGIALEI